MCENMASWRKHVKSSFTEIVPCDTLLPVDTDKKRTPLLFNVRPSPHQAVDVSRMLLSVKFLVKQKTENGWADIGVNDSITLRNGFGFTLFEDVQLNMNGVLTETAQREYGRISYLKNLLFCGNPQKLESALYFEDAPGYVARIQQNADKNLGEHTRSMLIKKGNTVSFLAPIYLNTLQADIYFPETVGFSLKFYPARSEACLQQQTAAGAQPVELKAEIEHAELLVPRLQVSSALTKTLSASFEAVKVLTFIHPKELSTFSRSLNVSPVPKKMAIVLLNEKQLAGAHDNHPFYFEHQNLKNLTVRCNGTVQPSLGGMRADFDKKDWSEPYNALFSQLGVTRVPFPMSMYDNGYGIYGVSLGEKTQKFGTVDVDIELGKVPTKNIAVLIFCFYDSKIKIDSKGEVQSDVNLKM